MPSLKISSLLLLKLSLSFLGPILYGLFYFGALGSKPEGASDCYVIVGSNKGLGSPDSDRAYTLEEVKSAISADASIMTYNMTARFDQIISLGFYIHTLLLISQGLRNYRKIREWFCGKNEENNGNYINSEDFVII